MLCVKCTQNNIGTIAHIIQHVLKVNQNDGTIYI